MVKALRYNFMVLAIISGMSSAARHHPVNLTIAKNRVEAYYEDGHYTLDATKAVNKAIKHFEKIPVTPSAIIVFDIDDTLLSTFGLDKSISYGHVPELSQAYEKYGQLPVLPQTKRLYDYLMGRGFHTILLTGRKENAKEGTIKNLESQGITGFDEVITRSPEEEQLTALDYKTAHREALSKEGYDIIGSVGDQWSDLCGGFAGYQVKLPNYRYILE